MTDVTEFPSGYIANAGRMGGTYASWSAPTARNCMVEDGSTARCFYAYGTGFYYGFYWGGAFKGEASGTPFPTLNAALAWSDALPSPTPLPTASEINATDFSIGAYYTRSTPTASIYDIWTNDFGFAIPTDATIISVNGYIKHRRPSSIIEIDSMKITVSYESGGSQSPSSNAYFGGGPAMFRSPTDLFNILKKPIYEQRSRSNRFILWGV